MSLQLSLSVGPVDPQLVLRGSQSRQLVVVVQWGVVKRGEGLAVRIRAQVLEGSMVLQVAGYLDSAWDHQERRAEVVAYLLLGRTLGGVVEGGGKYGGWKSDCSDWWCMVAADPWVLLCPLCPVAGPLRPVWPPECVVYAALPLDSPRLPCPLRRSWGRQAELLVTRIAKTFRGYSHQMFNCKSDD